MSARNHNLSDASRTTPNEFSTNRRTNGRTNGRKLRNDKWLPCRGRDCNSHLAAVSLAPFPRLAAPTVVAPCASLAQKPFCSRRQRTTKRVFRTSGLQLASALLTLPVTTVYVGPYIAAECTPRKVTGPRAVADCTLHTLRSIEAMSANAQVLRLAV